MLFTYQIEDKNYLSYYCNEIKLFNNQKYFLKTTEIIQKYLSVLNNDMIYLNIQILITDNPDLKLSELQIILRTFTLKYIYKYLFKNFKIFIREFILKKINLPIKITAPNINELKIELNYEIKTENFFIEIKTEPNIANFATDEINYFMFNSSHMIVNQSPFIFTKICNKKIINFYELGHINIENLIREKLKDFKAVHFYSIYQKCKMIKCNFIPMKIILHEDHSKINFSFDDRNLLFSIITDLKGGIKIINDSFIFKSNKENNKIILEYILNFLKKTNLSDSYNANIKNDSHFINTPNKFNHFIFTNFLNTYFSLYGLSMFLEELNEKKIYLKFLLFENKQINKKLYIDIIIQLDDNYSFYYSNVFCTLISNDVTVNQINETQNITIDDYIINKHLQGNTQETRKQKLKIETLKKIVKFVIFCTNYYEEFYKNMIDSSNYIKNIRKENNTNKIIIKVTENISSFENLIDKEIFNDLIYLIEEIHICENNFYIKIFFNKENLNLRFGGFPLHNYSMFDIDTMLFFDVKHYSVNVFFLTKIVKNEFWSHYKKFYTKFLNKLIYYINKFSNIIRKSEMKNILNNSANVLISPIGIQFTHNFFQLSQKNVNVHYTSLQYNTDKRKNTRIMIFPLEHHQICIHNLEVQFRQLQESDENSFLFNLENYIFYSYIYNYISKKFPSFIYPITDISYDHINNFAKIFFLIKDNKSFEIIKVNKISLIIEIINPNTINLFSNYLINPEECHKFMQSLNGNDSDNFIDSNRKLIVLTNDTINLIHELSKVLDHFEKF